MVIQKDHLLPPWSRDIDPGPVPQSLLDVDDRARTSFYPWRGQFSPQLVEAILNHYSNPGDRVLDPFVGSGTTLFEAARRGLECHGTEISVAGVALASMAMFCNLASSERAAVITEAGEVLDALTAPFREGLFAHHSEKAQHGLEGAVREAMTTIVEDDVRTFVRTTVMLAMGHGDSLTVRDLDRAFVSNARSVQEMPLTDKAINVDLADARDLPLDVSAVDLVVTSPPYINVFNYHQNYRKAVELLGERDILESARSEIGANRKHRSNRFKTVIQYCLDAHLFLREIARVLRPQGSAVLVVGRESCIRRQRFQNGLILMALGPGAGLTLTRRQERSFTNRFGKTIFEDVLTFEVCSSKEVSGESVDPREVGRWALESALKHSPPNIAKEIQDAIEQSERIEPSPILHRRK